MPRVCLSLSGHSGPELDQQHRSQTCLPGSTKPCASTRRAQPALTCLATTTPAEPAVTCRALPARRSPAETRREEPCIAGASLHVSEPRLPGRASTRPDLPNVSTFASPAMSRLPKDRKRQAQPTLASIMPALPTPRLQSTRPDVIRSACRVQHSLANISRATASLPAEPDLICPETPSLDTSNNRLAGTAEHATSPDDFSPACLVPHQTASTRQSAPCVRALPAKPRHRLVEPRRFLA